MNIKLCILSLSAFTIFLSCSNGSDKKEGSIKNTENDSTFLSSKENDYSSNLKNSKPTEAKPEVQTDLEQLKTEASKLSGGASIKTVELENGKALITYVKSYKEYKDLNPQSGLTENDLKSYWSTGNAIQKMLVGSPARLMKKLDFINGVKIILPFENKVYQMDIKKSELEKFVGKSISEIENDWVKSFADPYIYDKKGREKFFKQFGKIKNN